MNRQLIATHKTIGKYKVEVAKERILEINPNAKVEIYQEFFMPDSKELLDDTVDYIIDCVDTVTAKTDIYKTSVCPLAKVMRKELRSRNIKELKVVYSKEEPIKIDQTIVNDCTSSQEERKGTHKKQIPGSISFVPSVAGLIISGEVIKDIIKN